MLVLLVATFLAIVTVLGIWLEMNRETGWRYVWAPLVLVFLAFFLEAIGEHAGVSMLSFALLAVVFPLAALSLGGVIGVVTRRRLEPKNVMFASGFVVFGLVFLALLF